MTRQIEDLAVPILRMSDDQLNDFINRLRENREVIRLDEQRIVLKKNNAVRQKRQAKKATTKVNDLFEGMTEGEKALLLKQLES